MATAGFLGFAPPTRSNGNAGANSIFLTSFVAQQSGSAVAVLLDCFSATGSTTLKALVYDGSHSALLAQSAQFNSTAANYNRFPLTAPLSIVAGTTYYVGYVCSTNLPVSIASRTGSWFVSGGQSVTTPANPLVGGTSSSNGLMIALEYDGASAAGFGFSVDQPSGVTLSASNTIATFPTTVRQGARSVVTQVSGTGKWYAEVKVDGTINNNVGVGLATANWFVGDGTVQQAYVYFLLPTGTLQGPAGTTALGLTYVSGDVIGIAYDAGANMLWFNKNNGSWFGASSTAGNPVAGTGGAGVQSTQWPVTVAVSTGATTGASGNRTLRDTSGAFQYVPPSGFSAWSAATYPVPTGALRRHVMVVG